MRNRMFGLLALGVIVVGFVVAGSQDVAGNRSLTDPELNRRAGPGRPASARDDRPRPGSEACWRPAMFGGLGHLGIALRFFRGGSSRETGTSPPCKSSRWPCWPISPNAIGCTSHEDRFFRDQSPCQVAAKSQLLGQGHGNHGAGHAEK